MLKGFGRDTISSNNIQNDAVVRLLTLEETVVSQNDKMDTGLRLLVSFGGSFTIWGPLVSEAALTSNHKLRLFKIN